MAPILETIAVVADLPMQHLQCLVLNCRLCFSLVLGPPGAPSESQFLHDSCWQLKTIRSSKSCFLKQLRLSVGS